MNKFQARERRARKTRAKIKSLGVSRLCVFRTPRHIYAQVIGEQGKILASASSIDKDLRGKVGSNIAAAEAVGALVAERAVANGVTKVAFDRNGFKFHGRIKALADKAREAGLNF
ncbi:MAG: 50S ribosomal protein L18 [Gammaproteobacteria bacterium]|nr:50S ribosomal protein L18 [Gammaproteobacteria bacterium]HBF07912.1 50S ribosomal protein L18 [Gammaproteobacteria bacterium]|tara:strand:+ start:9124 stop:9468 length:345 start_codon:yes stop_codon:yes gene_type:complete